MNDDIPAELQDFGFDELTNNQQNIWRLRDELNATRRWLRENTVSEEEIGSADEYVNPSQGVSIAAMGDTKNHEARFEGLKYSMRPGVRVTKNGKYYEEGKGFIKKENAFL